MVEIKLLFTSVGRRVELIQAYKKAAEQCGVNLSIYGTDISTSAPALQFCDYSEIVCRIKDINYIPSLLQICKREHVNAIIPTIDTDLLLLSQNRKKFEEFGTKVIISQEDKIALCRDKRLTFDFFVSCGLMSPATFDDYLKYDHGFPAFIKPKDGSSSIDAFKVNSESELKTYAEKIKDYIIQPFISGEEYTVDIFCDFEGNPIFITPRKRLAVRSGEVLKTEIVVDDNIEKEMLMLISKFKPCGAITVQLIHDIKSDRNYYIEINPRYGGGAPLSIKAGADSPKAMISLLLGCQEKYHKNAARGGLIFSRYDQSICVTNINDNSNIKAVIFDLDDTLYSEKEYVISGFHSICNAFPEIENCFDKLCEAFNKGKPAIDYFLKSEGIYSEESKQKCLSIYRSHIPNIHLYDGVEEIFKVLRDKKIKIGIITDGRPEGQRNKIYALGLDKLVDEIIITDEIGGVKFRKPNDIAFRIMQVKMETEFYNMAYVGDNINKDFIAPKKLGMKSILFKNIDGLYANDATDKNIIVIDNIKNLLSIL